MPLPVPIPDNQCVVIEVQMHGTVSSAGGDAKNANNIFHFRRTSVVNPITEVAAEAAFNTNVSAALIAALNLRYTQTFNAVRFINDATRPFVDVPRTGPGAITGDSMPLDSSLYVLGRSSFRGKSFKAGKHLFPLSESDTTTATADIINAAALTRFQTFAAAWLAGFTDANSNVWVPCVLSRLNSQLKVNPTTVATSDLQQFAVNQRVASQKRHLIKSVY